MSHLLVAAIVGLITILAALTIYWVRRYVIVAEDSDNYLIAETSDGVCLPIWHYPSSLPKTKRYPVVLCHGLASTRYNMDLNEDISLARFLSRAGFDVYIPELRGSAAGTALNPHSTNKEYWNFCFDDHAKFDVPAIIAKVKKETSADKLHWIGHSMGGMVVLAGVNNNVTDDIASLTCLGSPARFQWAVGRTKVLAMFGSSIKWTRAPLPELGRIAIVGAALLRWFVWKGPINGRNVRGQDLLAAFANLPSYVSIGMLKQIRQWMKTGLFVDLEGNDYVQFLAQAKCPALFVAGTADTVANIDAVKVGYESWGHPDKEFYVLGRVSGHYYDYGHIDLTIGFRAPREVYPKLLDWVNAHDDAG